MGEQTDQAIVDRDRRRDPEHFDYLESMAPAETFLSVHVDRRH
jgi:hypothetical protein